MTFNNTTLANNLYPVANALSSSNPFIQVFMGRDPTSADVNYPIQKLWLNTSTNNLWELKNFTTSGGNLSAVWIPITGATTMLQFTVQTGTTTVLPNAGNVNFNGAVVAQNGHPVRTDGTAADTMALEVQYATTDSDGTGAATKAGLASFKSADFTVDSHGWVSLNGEAGFDWNVINQGTEPTNFLVNNGYICQAGGTGNVSIALPAASALGDLIEIVLDGATSWKITQGAGQSIRFSNATTTVTTGSLVTTGTGDAVRMVCETANLKWVVLSSIGNLTVN